MAVGGSGVGEDATVEHLQRRHGDLGHGLQVGAVEEADLTPHGVHAIHAVVPHHPHQLAQVILTHLYRRPENMSVLRMYL